MPRKITVSSKERPEINWPARLFTILDEYGLEEGKWCLLDDETLELLVSIDDVFAHEDEVWIIELKTGVYNLYVPDEQFWVQWDKKFDALTAQCSQ